MSIPVQVAVTSGTLMPAVEEIQARLGTIGGAQMLWVLGDLEQPDVQQRAAGQVRAMLGARRHEGGFAQIVLAHDVAAMQLALSVLQGAEPGRTPWARVVIGLFEENDVAEPLPLGVSAIHVVPAALAYRELVWRERERSAANLLGMLTDLARSDRARESWQQWVSMYGGVRVTLAQAARFQAPMVQRVLARRLASRVVERMVDALQQGGRGQTAPRLADPPAAPDHDVQEALSQRAHSLGEKVAVRIVGGDDDGQPLADEEVLHQRARREVRELPQKLEDVLKRHGSDLREKALAWQGELRRWVDAALEQASFAALAGVIARLDGWQEQLTFPDHAGSQHGPRQALQLDPPDSAQVRAAVLALETALAAHDDSHLLFGGWSLAIGTTVGLSSAAGLRALGVQAPLGAGGVGVLVVLAGAGISAVRARLAQAQLRRLRADEQTARQAYRTAWTRLIERQIADIGAVLNQRMVRFAAEVVRSELVWLRSVHDTLSDLQQQYQKPERLRMASDSAFESDIRLPEEFYAKAEQVADASPLFAEYEAQLAQPNWRQRLGFMNSDALMKQCEVAYGSFREQIPVDQRAELRDVALGPTGLAIQQMLDRLGDYLPPEFGADTMVVLPQRLSDAVPSDRVGALQLHLGVSDVFAAMSRPAQAGRVP